jgi:glycerol-3-phosphate dehydrogenase
MWQKGWRDQLWSELEQPWDVLIIGGGITGAGILREASRTGLRALLVEARDFASGTSSRSSKLVHGGFRYLKNGQIKLTFESVRERERLLKEGRGLVNPLGFLLANYHGDAIPAWLFGAALVLYDLLAFQWGHRRYDAYDIHDLCPYLNQDGLSGGYRYFDAQTDDARLVLRLIQESISDGGAALNYTRAGDLLRNRQGQVRGAIVFDDTPDGNGRNIEVHAHAVINATGAWADELRLKMGERARLRRLRGSHLILPSSRVPLSRSVSFLHPADDRPVFAFPWEGVTLVGTTDVDLDEPLSTDPAISPAEAEYLLQAAQYAFACQELTPDDVQCTYSGVRPVVNTGKTDPSKESREYVLWSENGLLTITGGKLTTFRLMACDALKKIRMCIPDCPDLHPRQRVLNPPPGEVDFPDGLSPATRLRLLGRHGQNTPALIQAGEAKDFAPIGGTPALWAELRWAARAEAVVHLDDLLLRRTRLGLLLPHGGQDCLPSIRTVAQPELGWEDTRWESESAAYIDMWHRSYSPKP